LSGGGSGGLGWLGWRKWWFRLVRVEEVVVEEVS